MAVSGGLDSVVLLHMLVGLTKDKPVDLVVAHVDHGIRQDSDADAWHVAMLAKSYGLPFEVTYLGLGKGANEELARNQRYRWLESLKDKYRADSIVTAHHQDDQLETIALNFYRGTGWRGLSSLQTSDDRFRPLLDLPKTSLVRYAIDNQLVWREDETNGDLRYTRNYIRHRLIPRLTKANRDKLATLSKKQRKIRREIEIEAKSMLDKITDDNGIDRYSLIMMPDNVALELLRLATDGRHEPYQLRRLQHFVKTGRQGAVLNLGKGKNALLTRRHLIV